MNNDYFLFTTKSGSQYLYDVNTNTTHPVSESVCEDFIDKVYGTKDNVDLQALADQYEEFRTLIQYFIIWRNKTDAFRSYPKQNKVLISTMEDSQNSQITSGLAWDLVLVTTEECNMRCAYCVHDESVYSNRRTHQPKYMDFDTSKKAIDYYLALNQQDRVKPFKSRALNIVFYGGEALLNWQVVKKSIAHIKEKYTGNAQMHIGISTNLTLFDIDWLPFLIENEVFLNVSLDGPKGEHDRYRKFADGEPTFDVITAKLNQIYEADSQYFSKFVKTLITYNGNTNFQEVADFYENSPIALKIQMISRLKDLETSEFHKLNPFSIESYQNSLIELNNTYEKMCLDGKQFERGEIYYSLCYDYQSGFFNTPHSKSRLKNWYTGSCAPGRKISVAPDGNFYICERVGTDRPVGHVDNGLDEEKVISYFNDFFNASEDCPSCFARSRCRICPATVDSGENFDFKAHCENTRQVLVSSFSDLYSLLEKKPDLFAKEFEFF